MVIQYRLFCLMLFLVAQVTVGLVDAQDAPRPDSENSSAEIAEVNRVLDLVESEVSRRQVLLQSGSRIHAEYFRDLLQEYRRVVNDLRFSSQQNLIAKVKSLQRTERHLALQLWQLDRLRPLMAEVDDEYRSLTKTLRDLKSKQSKIIKNELVAERFEEVSAKVDKVEHERLQRRLISERTYYDVRMWDELLSAKQLQQKKQLEETSRGPIDRLRKPIQRMTRLKWSDGKFAVDRSHWEDLFLPESLADIALEVATEFEVRGWKLSSQAHRSFLPENVFYRREPGIVLLFQNLRFAVLQQSEKQIRTSILRKDEGGQFSTEELRGAYSNINGRYLFSLEELGGAKRQLEVVDHPDEWKLTLTNFGNQVLELQQGQEQAVIRVSTASEAWEREGPTMADIYAQNTDWFEREIFPELQSVGVLVPETRFDSRVIEGVVARLRVADPSVIQGLTQLLAQIDSAKFKTRTEATKRLEANLPSYGPLLAELRRDRSLSLEVRMRIQRAIEVRQRDFGELELLITKLELINDVDYLKKIHDRVGQHDQPLIQSRINGLSTRQP